MVKKKNLQITQLGETTLNLHCVHGRSERRRQQDLMKENPKVQFRRLSSPAGPEWPESSVQPPFGLA